MFHIMVVEDDAHTRKLMQAVLEQNGYSTVPAGDGEEALEMMDRHHVDLILLDVMMPRMDGFTFLKTLREGNRVLIFPEGTRVRKGKKVEAHSGALLMANRAKVPVVPIYVSTKKHLFSPILLRFGEPYFPEYAAAKATPEELTLRSAELLEKIYAMGDER